MSLPFLSVFKLISDLNILFDYLLDYILILNKIKWQRNMLVLQSLHLSSRTFQMKICK